MDTDMDIKRKFFNTIIDTLIHVYTCYMYITNKSTFLKDIRGSK